MYQGYERLPGTLEGISILEFHRIYPVIKQNINNFRSLPTWVSNYIVKLGRVVKKFGDEKRTDLADETRVEIRKANDDMKKAWQAKQTADKYARNFSSAAAYPPTSIKISMKLSGLPVYEMPAAAMAGASWLVNYGMAVVQDYKVKLNWTDSDIAKMIEGGKVTTKGFQFGTTQVMYGAIALVALFAFMKTRSL